MPLAPSASRVQGGLGTADDTPQLPPPDMAMVQKMINDAVAKAHVKQQKESKMQKGPRGAEGIAAHRSGASKWNNASSVCKRWSAPTYVLDFAWAFLLTFLAIYFVVAGYSLYRKVSIARDAL
ncbi:hypothetical protein DQ04_03691090 [Trypanosoma grayi]|uniref:hypothetical protein n=1 Tax=Trypanosoma grayi TaxID=71804 RepID=UPI0004F4096A|nr:hypothetical protein DQ04_03691090 [Trypanosoma grayi]KEG10464.1 hypothetical protein DQ04_03691090 [Trypanosoma grayi]